MAGGKTILTIWFFVLVTSAFSQVEDLRTETVDTLSEDFIISVMNRVNDYQLKVTKGKENRNWKQATYYTGVMAFFQATKDQKILDQEYLQH